MSNLKDKGVVEREWKRGTSDICEREYLSGVEQPVINKMEKPVIFHDRLSNARLPLTLFRTYV